MDKDLNEFIQRVSDEYLYEMITTIFKNIFPPESIMHVMLPTLRKHGMPVKNIVPFINELSNIINKTDEHDNLQQEFTDLLRRSGFAREGDDTHDGNG